MPVMESIRNWTLAPAASPPGRTLVTALPASPAVMTANHVPFRTTRRSSDIERKKLESSATNIKTSHQGDSVARRGHAETTWVSAGRTMYNPTPATTTATTRPTTEALRRGGGSVSIEPTYSANINAHRCDRPTLTRGVAQRAP